MVYGFMFICGLREKMIEKRGGGRGKDIDLRTIETSELLRLEASCFENK